MNCPVCGQGLREIERSGINIDVCPGCKGVWLDRGELEKLLEREGAVGTVPPAADRPLPAYEREHHSDHRHHDDDDDWDERRGAYGDPRRRKRRGFLGEIFDVFD